MVTPASGGSPGSRTPFAFRSSNFDAADRVRDELVSEVEARDVGVAELDEVAEVARDDARARRGDRAVRSANTRAARRSVTRYVPPSVRPQTRNEPSAPVSPERTTPLPLSKSISTPATPASPESRTPFPFASCELDAGRAEGRLAVALVLDAEREHARELGAKSVKAAVPADRVDDVRIAVETVDGRDPDEVGRLPRYRRRRTGSEMDRPEPQAVVVRLQSGHAAGSDRPVRIVAMTPWRTVNAAGDRVRREEAAARRVGHLEVVVAVGKEIGGSARRRRRARGEEDVGAVREDLARGARRGRPSGSCRESERAAGKRADRNHTTSRPTERRTDFMPTSFLGSAMERWFTRPSTPVRRQCMQTGCRAARRATRRVYGGRVRLRGGADAHHGVRSDGPRPASLEQRRRPRDRRSHVRKRDRRARGPRACTVGQAGVLLAVCDGVGRPARRRDRERARALASSSRKWKTPATTARGARAFGAAVERVNRAVWKKAQRGSDASRAWRRR